MSRLVDYNDVRLCIALGIKRGMSLREFADFVETWEDFVEKPEWIPVSERLPDESGWYLVTMGKRYSDADVKDVNIIKYYEDGIWKAYGTEVYAWMPLPEPYQEPDENAKEDEGGH